MMDSEKQQLTTRIRRWDDIRRNQFGVALTTFTALATGGVGFSAKLIADDKVHFSYWASSWFLISALAFGLGLLCGVFATWTRLRDARLTARKLHQQNKGATSDELNSIESKFKFWGSVTWFLFHTLVLAVSIGIICLTCCVAALYGDKLFCNVSDTAIIKQTQSMTVEKSSAQTNSLKAH